MEPQIKENPAPGKGEGFLSYLSLILKTTWMSGCLYGLDVGGIRSEIGTGLFDLDGEKGDAVGVTLAEWQQGIA